MDVGRFLLLPTSNSSDLWISNGNFATYTDKGGCVHSCVRLCKRVCEGVCMYVYIYAVKLKTGPRFGGFKVKNWSKFKVKNWSKFCFHCFFPVL